jgi:putative NIF3 family GTP cyclohydrolase 1 type 2
MATAACDQIIGCLDDLLNPTAYDDYGPNGLQVPGSEQIQTIVTRVSAKPTNCVDSSAETGPDPTQFAPRSKRAWPTLPR